MAAELVVEDELSDSVLRRLVAAAKPTLKIENSRITSGFGQIRKNIRAFNNLARLKPVIVLTDLDHADCAPTLIGEWLSDIDAEPNLIFRVAVREVESWVMADRERVARFLSLQINMVPAYPDQVADPKQTFLDLVRHSPTRSLKKALLPVGQTAKIGPGYNELMSEFVIDKWRADVARGSSPSLERAMSAVAAVQT